MADVEHHRPVRQVRCSARVPEGYDSGISHPPKADHLGPQVTVGLVQRAVPQVGHAVWWLTKVATAATATAPGAQGHDLLVDLRLHRCHGQQLQDALASTHDVDELVALAQQHGAAVDHHVGELMSPGLRAQVGEHVRTVSSRTPASRSFLTSGARAGSWRSTGRWLPSWWRRRARVDEVGPAHVHVLRVPVVASVEPQPSVRRGGMSGRGLDVGAAAVCSRESVLPRT